MLTLLLCTVVLPVMDLGAQSDCFGALEMLINDVLMKRVDEQDLLTGQKKVERG